MNSSDPHLEKRLVEVQRRTASRVVLQDQFSEEAVAGVDQAFLGGWSYPEPWCSLHLFVSLAKPARS
ncbi:Uncharacterised protein [uncultured archaeon]|nr:Uncharacterised protein [uncultured archaeon]